MPSKTQCRLPASGFTDTINEVYDWAKSVVTQIKESVPGQSITAHIWAYREQETEWLAADFSNEAEQCFSITFLIGEEHDYEIESPCVPDMTEALHMTGILCESVGATVTLGRRDNEVNKYCTPETWQTGQTNGKLVIAMSHTQNT